MAVAQISILSREEIELMHERTLSILQNPGVKICSAAALKVLEDSGAKVDNKKMIASIPEDLVKETLKKLPRKVTLAARNPKQDMKAPRPGPPFMATNGTAIYIRDMATGEKRTTTSRDLGNFQLLCDALDPLDYVWPIVTAHDAPQRTHALSELAISLMHTTKHFQGEGMSAEEAKAEVEVASAFVGGEDELSKRPIFSAIQCPICPLEFEKGSIEATMEFAKAGIPVVSMSMALCGLTSPVSLAATMAIVNAENLASFAISQMTKAGAPVIYSSESTSPSMITGEIHYGALEEVLLAAAAAQMAHHYGVTCMVGGFNLGIGNENIGINLDPAEFLFTSMTALTGTDWASGIGGLDQAKGAALEQVVMDCDMWEVVKQSRKTVPMDEDHFLLSLIRSVGPGGSFLNRPHTAKNLKKELFMPSKEKAELYKAYNLGRSWKDVIANARARVKDILANHKPEQVDTDVKDKVYKILDRFA